jgi:hypothetical protein
MTRLTRQDTERGSALVLAMMAVLVMMAIAAALVSISVIETQIAAHFERGVQAFQGAEEALARAIVELSALEDWNAALDGTAVSTLTDGPRSGVRTIAGAVVNLDEATHLLQCGRLTVCSEADVSAITTDRPWGRNNPHWQPYAWGPLAGGWQLPIYVVVWVADDPAETDGDPFHDGATADNPGRGRLVLAVHAYAAGGVRRALEATVARPITEDEAVARLRVVSWREMR